MIYDQSILFAGGTYLVWRSYTCLLTSASLHLSGLPDASSVIVTVINVIHIIHIFSCLFFVFHPSLLLCLPNRFLSEDMITGKCEEGSFACFAELEMLILILMLMTMKDDAECGRQ